MHEAESARGRKAKALSFTVDQCRGDRPSLQSYTDHDAKPDPHDVSTSTPAQPAPWSADNAACSRKSCSRTHPPTALLSFRMQADSRSQNNPTPRLYMASCSHENSRRSDAFVGMGLRTGHRRGLFYGVHAVGAADAVSAWHPALPSPSTPASPPLAATRTRPSTQDSTNDRPTAPFSTAAGALLRARHKFAPRYFPHLSTRTPRGSHHRAPLARSGARRDADHTHAAGIGAERYQPLAPVHRHLCTPQKDQEGLRPEVDACPRLRKRAANNAMLI